MAAVHVYLAADRNNLKLCRELSHLEAERRELQLLPAIEGWLAEGLSLCEVGKRLNAQGYRTKHGGKWNARSVRLLTCAARVAG